MAAAQLQNPTTTTPKFPRDLSERLLRGELTLADVFGLDQQALYEIAAIGYDFLISGKLTEAKRVYEGLVAADPYDSVFHCHLAATHHKLGDLEDAFRHYERSLELNRANGDALVGRGEIHLMRGELLQGLSDLKCAVTLDTDLKRSSSVRAQQLLLALKRQVEEKKST